MFVRAMCVRACVGLCRVRPCVREAVQSVGLCHVHKCVGLCRLCVCVYVCVGQRRGCVHAVCVCVCVCVRLCRVYGAVQCLSVRTWG